MTFASIMNRDRVLVLVAVFATSQCAIYNISKLANYSQNIMYLLKTIYMNNCTGTIYSIIHLKKFSVFAISLIKQAFYILNCNQFYMNQVCGIVINFCAHLEKLCICSWDALLCLSTEIHYNLCDAFSTWIPLLWSHMSNSINQFLDNWNLSGFGSIALLFIVLLLCAVIYFTFIVFLIIVRLYKLFIKPFIKMLTTLLNYRRRFVLRSRRL